MIVKYDALIKESRDKEIALDERTDGIDMDLVKISDQFVEMQDKVDEIVQEFEKQQRQKKLQQEYEEKLRQEELERIEKEKEEL